MLDISIPGLGERELKYLVLDYNGTIALDGDLITGVQELIIKISKIFEIYVLTSDTYGTVREKCKNLPVKISTYPCDNAMDRKYDEVIKLGSKNVVAIGNGRNDCRMCKEAILSIGIMENEGVSGLLIQNVDIVCKSIMEALELLLNEKRIIATLRG